MSEGALEGYPALRKHDDSQTAPVYGGVRWLLPVITECQLLSPSYPSLCCMQPEGCPHSLPPHFVPNGAMERQQDWNKTCTSYIHSPIFLKLPSRFSNEVGEQCIYSVPGKILPLADVFLGRIFCWVCFFSFQASSRWLTSLISSGNSSAPVLPSRTTPQPQYGAVSELSDA